MKDGFNRLSGNEQSALEQCYPKEEKKTGRKPEQSGSLFLKDS